MRYVVHEESGVSITRQAAHYNTIMFSSREEDYKRPAVSGRPPKYPEAQKARVAQLAMEYKHDKGFIDVSLFMKEADANIQDALTHEGERMSHNTVTRIFETRCFDRHPRYPWIWQYPWTRTVLDGPVVQRRSNWCDDLISLLLDEEALYNDIIWFDAWSKIESNKRWRDIDTPVTGGKIWVSSDSMTDRNNQRRSQFHRQAHTGDTKIWHMCVLCRGYVANFYLGHHKIGTPQDTPQYWTEDAVHLAR